MGLCQPVTIETESCGIEGDHLRREVLELEEGGGGGKERGREERIHSVAACHVHHTQCNKMPWQASCTQRVVGMVTHPSESLQKALEQSDSKRMLPRLPVQLRLLKMEGIGEGGVESFRNLIRCLLGVQVL